MAFISWLRHLKSRFDSTKAFHLRRQEQKKGIPFVKPRLEQLEDRTLLSTAANVFATFDGLLAHTTDTQQIPISISSANFSLSGINTVMLGFHLERVSGSNLDPAVVQIKNAKGRSD